MNNLCKATCLVGAELRPDCSSPRSVCAGLCVPTVLCPARETWEGGLLVAGRTSGLWDRRLRELMVGPWGAPLVELTVHSWGWECQFLEVLMPRLWPLRFARWLISFVISLLTHSRVLSQSPWKTTQEIHLESNDVAACFPLEAWKHTQACTHAHAHTYLLVSFVLAFVCLCGCLWVQLETLGMTFSLGL